MSRPIRDVDIETYDELTAHVRAVFDTGAHISIIREDRLPKGTNVERRKNPIRLRTAGRGGTLEVVGGVILVMTIEGRMIQDEVQVSPDLSQEMLIGAKTMQAWDITIRNENGNTQVVVGKDLRDPDIQEVD